MKKEIEKVKFHFTFGYLKQLGDRTLDLIDRDITEFTGKGFTPARRTAFVDAINVFANFPTDEQMDGLKIEATAVKNQSRGVVESHMRDIFLAAEIVYGLNSGLYRRFGNAELSSQTDYELVRNANMMVETATEYAAALLPEGIDAAKITALKDAKIKFDKDIDLKETAVKNRDNSTEMRAKVANALYDLISRYCKTGRNIWYEISEAKYNDYIIYNTPSGSDDGSGTNDELTGTVEPSSVKTVTTIDEDAVITMYNNGSDKLYFALSPTEGSGGTDLAVDTGQTITKTTSDLSPDGDGTFLLVKNPNATMIGSYTVVLDF
ncbi:MAG TPA: hypothetical protein PK431_12445 [Chitinophagales bacterium]|nr:hypothetical protein [Chitinophagales bacterium]